MIQRDKVSVMSSGPVVMKQRGVAVHVGDEEVLGFLDRFVGGRDGVGGIITTTTPAAGAAGSSTSSTNTTATVPPTGIALLKRVQRDFKGLPPQE